MIALGEDATHPDLHAATMWELGNRIPALPAGPTRSAAIEGFFSGLRPSRPTEVQTVSEQLTLTPEEKTVIQQALIRAAAH